MSSPRLPDFFIVGAPKCGTTALYEYLRAHPDLFVPNRKELNFFGSDLELRGRPRPDLTGYLAYFRDAPEQERIGTAYVWYLFSRDAAAEIGRLAPDARIIAMVRNPIDVLPALHSENLFNGNEDISDVAAALEAEADRKSGRRIPSRAYQPYALLYSEVPRYTEQLERYVRVFGRDRVHVIVFDDFVADPPTAYHGVLEFLEVDATFRPPTFGVVNANKRLRSESVRHLLAHPPDRPRRLIRAVVPGPVRRALYERAKRLNVRSSRRPPLPGQVRERLHVIFRDEIVRLSRFLGRDLGHWLAESGELLDLPEPSTPRDAGP